MYQNVGEPCVWKWHACDTVVLYHQASTHTIARMRSTQSLRSFPNIAFKTVAMFVWLMMALSCPFKEDYPHLPFPGDQLCDILALCLQVVSHAPQHLRTSEVQATCDGCFPASLSPGPGMFRAVHPQSFQRWMSNNEICQSEIFHFLQQAQWICEDDDMSGLTVTSWGNPVEVTRDSFHLHCQAGGWDCVGCPIIIMDGGCILLDSEAPPYLVFGD